MHHSRHARKQNSMHGLTDLHVGPQRSQSLVVVGDWTSLIPAKTIVDGRHIRNPAPGDRWISHVVSTIQGAAGFLPSNHVKPVKS